MKSKIRKKAIEQKKFLEREAARLHLYGLLHAIYSYPTEKSLEFIRLDISSMQFKESIRYLGLALEDNFLSLYASINIKDLEVEYTRLFINSCHGVLAKPYASVYIDNKGSIMGESAIWIRDFYLQFGVKVRDNYPEPPDHVIVELEFMHYLISNEIKAYCDADIERGDWFHTGQIKFMSEHFLKWADMFFNLVCMHSSHRFYQEAGIISKAFFTSEKSKSL